MFNSNENKNRTIKQYLSKALTVASHPTRREILKQFRNGKSLSAAELTDILIKYGKTVEEIRKIGL